MRIKKILREPLLYLLLITIITFIMAFNINNDKSEITDIKLTRNHITESIKFPYLTYNISQNETFLVSFNLLAKNKSVKLNIIPDDCIQEIKINEKIFPLEGINGICDFQKGAYFDFSKYVLYGLNDFNLRISNRGGPAGLDIVESSLKQFSFTYLVFVLFLLASFSLMLWKFKNNKTIFKLILLFATSFIFWLITNSTSQVPTIIPTDSIVFLTIIFFATSLIFVLNKRVNYTAFFFILIAFAAFMLIRGGLLYFKSSDYNVFLAHWVAQMHNLSLKEAISAKIGDYNMPYLYILALISRSNINSLFLIKLVSIAFDAILAYYAMKIVSIKFESINIQIAAFITMLGIPTVILNGAFWGQCDVIYAALSFALLYYGFTSKSIRCFIFFGLAFSFKLQTVFIAPMIIVFIFLKKIKISHLCIPTIAT